MTVSNKPSRLFKPNLCDEPKVGGNDGGSAWQFINLSMSRHAPNAKLRKVIRVKAMRSYHQRRNQSETRARLSLMPMHHRDSQPLTRTTGLSSSVTLEHLGKDQGDTRSKNRISDRCSPLDELLDETQGSCDPLASPIASLDLEQPALVSDDLGLFVSSLKSEVAHLDPMTDCSPCSLLGSGNTDPFDCLPIKDCPRNSEYLHHCKPLMNLESLLHHRFAIWLAAWLSFEHLS